MNVLDGLRAEFELFKHAAWLQAEAATNGYWLSRKGRNVGIDPARLWDMPWERVEELASDELLDFWRQNGRWTWAEYRDQALRELPLARVEAVAREVPYWWPRVEVHQPDGTVETVTCLHQVYGHETEKTALACGRRLAALRGVKLAV